MPDSTLPANATRPPEAACNACGTTAVLETAGHRASPDSAVTCPPESGCCQEPHDHASPGCPRTITITAFAHIAGEAGR